MVIIAVLDMINIKYILTILALAWLMIGCKHEPGAIPPDAVKSNYPPKIEKIIVTKCATAGCHNAKSYSAAGGLRLDTWEHMFNGSNNGAVVVAYSPDFSSLLYFINDDEDRGIVAEPTMPVNGTPLSEDEYNTVKEWIEAGAPDAQGNIPFSSRAETRQKIYTVQEECDVLAVIDAEKNVVMRYIEMGSFPYPESMNDIVISNDGKYLYAVFWLNNSIQKVDITTDKIVAETATQKIFWTSIAISDDDSKLYLTCEDDNSVHIWDATTLQPIKIVSADMQYPKSVIGSNNFDTFFVASKYGNTVYKVIGDSVKKISIDGLVPSADISATAPNPWAMSMAPDGSKYFIVCVQSDELRVMDANADTLIKVIDIGLFPQQMAMSSKKPYLFITCMEDPSTANKSKGSVYVINYNTLEVVKRIEDKFYEPYGISVDDDNDIIYIVSANLTADGPAPHHGSPCDGRNGFYQLFDLNTLKPINNKRHEILVKPTATTVRF